jgi:prepilin-type N-terminal cleavage/methylation domain-containing protein
VRRHRPNAFTLIELLVVIAVIALLVTILMPSLTTARELAREAICLSSTRNLAVSQLLYAGENADRLSASFDPRLGDGRLDCLAPVGGDYADFRNCWGDILHWAHLDAPLDLYACPSDDAPIRCAGRGRISYGLSHYFYGYKKSGWGGCGRLPGLAAERGSSEGSRGQGYYGPALERDIARPGEKIMLADAPGEGVGTVGLWRFRGRGLIRHREFSAAYAFCDAHAERVSFQEMYGIEYDSEMDMNDNFVAAGIPGVEGTSQGAAETFPPWAPWLD